MKWRPTGRVFQGTEKKGNTCFPFSASVAVGLRRLAGLTINHPVELSVSQDDLHVFAGFRKRNGLDEFGNLFVVALSFPGGDTVLAGIVRGSSRFGRSELLDQAGDIHHAELDIVVGIEELVLYVADFDLLGEKLAGFGEQLHEAN